MKDKENELHLLKKATIKSVSKVDGLDMKFGEEQESLLEQKPEKKTSIVEGIKLSMRDSLHYISQNKRKLTATATLWTAFLTVSIALSELGPFFPVEV
jgi:hypothetical protein